MLGQKKEYMGSVNEDIFFSIITLTHNSYKYLRKNVLSVEKQAYRNFEHVFIDGNSTDKTLSLLKSYKLRYPKKVNVFTRKPVGISDAMNHGVRKSKGKYIIHLHSDDWFYDDMVLARVNAFLKKRNYPDWIYGKIQVVEENADKVGVFPRQKVFQIANPVILKYFNYIPHQAVFIKRSVFKKYGFFDLNLSSSMDYDFWLRIAKKTRWLFMNKIISNYRIHKGAQSSSKKNRRENVYRQRLIAKRHLSKIDYILFSTLKIFLDMYTSTLR